MAINKHLPSDIQKLSNADLIDIYYVHVKEYQKASKRITELEQFVNSIAAGKTTAPKWLESNATKLMRGK
jgi:hypothetical protein